MTARPRGSHRFASAPLALICSLIVLAACHKQAPEASAIATQSVAASHAPAGPLQTVAALAAKPQPQVKTIDFAPIVQTFGPDEVVLRSPPADVRVRSVTYRPTGVEIDAEVEQHDSLIGGQMYLNFADTGVLRDDLGTVYRLRDADNRLRTLAGGKGDRFKLRIFAAGFVPAAVKNFNLSLVIDGGSFRGKVETGWRAPPGLDVTDRALPRDEVQPGVGIRYAQPPTGTSLKGELAIRVFGVQWLADGIAVDFEAVNGSRDMRVDMSARHMRIVDDKNRKYSVVYRADDPSRSLYIPTGKLITGRLLFRPAILPDAKRLRLLANGGPEPDPWAPITPAVDGGGSPMVGVTLPDLPAGALPAPPHGGAASAPALNPYDMLAQAPFNAFDLDASTLDPIARLKADLGARDDTRGTTVDLPGDVLFDFDRATLRADAGPTLDKLADLMRRIDRPAALSGHTDAKGDAAYNLKLSADRAAAVKAALVSRGIDGGRLTTAGYGKTRPKVVETTPDGRDDPAARQTNRRVEVLIAPR